MLLSARVDNLVILNIEGHCMSKFANTTILSSIASTISSAVQLKVCFPQDILLKISVVV